MQASAEVDEARGARIGEESGWLEEEGFDEPPELGRRADRVRTELQKISIAPLRLHDASGTVGFLEEEDRLAPRRERVGPDEPRETAADDRGRQFQNAVGVAAMSVSAARNVGRSFRPEVRRKFAMPDRRASSPKSWSIS